METVLTPPYSDVLTPPLTDEKSEEDPIINSLLQFCRECQRGASQIKPWTKFGITSAQYDVFQQRARVDTKLWAYVEDCLRQVQFALLTSDTDYCRIDYDAYRSEVTVRMPSTLHDRFLQEVRQYIDHQLQQFEVRVVLSVNGQKISDRMDQRTFL